jgi:hypothetical protein
MKKYTYYEVVLVLDEVEFNEETQQEKRKTILRSFYQPNSTDRKKMFGIFDRTKVKIELDTGE